MNCAIVIVEVTVAYPAQSSYNDDEGGDYGAVGSFPDAYG